MTLIPPKRQADGRPESPPVREVDVAADQPAPPTTPPVRQDSTIEETPHLATTNGSPPPVRTQAVSPPVQDAATTAETDSNERLPEESTEPITADEPITVEPPESPVIETVDERTFPFRVLGGASSTIHWLFGLLSILVGLAALATIPIVNLLTLGYLIEVSGRIAREKKFSAGFVGVRKAAHIGGLAMGTWLFLWPPFILSDFWHSSQLIAPMSGQTIGLQIALWVVTILCVGHILMAWFCGGKLRHFFWPVLAVPFLAVWMTKTALRAVYRPEPTPGRRPFLDRMWLDITECQPLTQWFPPAILFVGIFGGNIYTKSRDAVWEFVIGLRLPYYFWLGVRGFFGTLAWIAIPVALLAAATLLPARAAPLLSVIGAFFMASVLFFLPYLQTNFGADNSLWSMFNIGRVLNQFIRAPVAFWFALFLLVLSATPLYLLMVEATPREIAGIPTFVFLLLILPARMVTGWAVARANRREKARFFLVPMASFLFALPVVGWYVLMVYLSQYITWRGAWTMFEQHAFLLPTPPMMDF